MKTPVLVALATAALTASACSTSSAAHAPDKKATAAAPKQAKEEQRSAKRNPIAASAGSSEGALSQEAQEVLQNFRRVHFAFDSSLLNEETRAALQANADILLKHPQIKVEIQGHADDRGTSEYNLALGDARARVVRDFLVRLGVDGRQISTLSLGEEAPFVSGRGEQAWAKNRRAEFRVTTRASAPVKGTT